MDSGKQMIFEERRKKAAKEVNLVKISEHCFNVVDEENNFKYCVCTIPGAEDCTCPSFKNNNTAKHDAAVGKFFLCKHIFAAQYTEEIQAKINKYSETHTSNLTENVS